MSTRLKGACSLAVLFLLAADSAALGAQGTCQVNGVATCNVGGTATYGISVTVTPAIRLTVSSSTVTIPAPDDASYIATFTTGSAIAYNIRANSAWTLSISSSATFWTAAPAEARQDKPTSDLQWSTTIGGTYADVSGTLATVNSGTATANLFASVFVRAKLAWLLDRPGTYQIPVVFTITAP